MNFSELSCKMCHNLSNNCDKFGSHTTDVVKNPNQYGKENDENPNR